MKSALYLEVKYRATSSLILNDEGRAMLRRKASVISSDYSSDNSSPRGNSSSPSSRSSRSEMGRRNVGDVVNRIEGPMEGKESHNPLLRKISKPLAENVSDDESKTVHTMDEEQSRASLKDVYRQWRRNHKRKKTTLSERMNQANRRKAGNNSSLDFKRCLKLVAQ